MDNARFWHVTVTFPENTPGMEARMGRDGKPLPADTMRIVVSSEGMKEQEAIDYAMEKITYAINPFEFAHPIKAEILGELKSVPKKSTPQPLRAKPTEVKDTVGVK